MKTWIYKGDRKADTYLYVTAQDDFTRVPDTLVQLLGEMSLILEVDLSAREKLARADIEQVRSCLADQGYYLQMPPNEGEQDGLSAC